MLDRRTGHWVTLEDKRLQIVGNLGALRRLHRVDWLAYQFKLLVLNAWNLQNFRNCIENVDLALRFFNHGCKILLLPVHL